MASGTSIEINKSIARLSSKKNSHTIDLTDFLGVRDITAINVKSKPPKEVSTLHLFIGGGSIFHFDYDDLNNSYVNNINLMESIAFDKPFVLETSRCSYMTVSLTWEYDKDFLKQKETEGIVMVDDMAEHIDAISDDESLYQDSETQEVRRGRRVYYSYEATGRKVPQEATFVVLEPPALTVGVRDACYATAEKRFERSMVVFWQPIDDTLHMSHDHIHKLVAEGRLRRQRRLYLKNELYFSHGTGGVRYVY